MKKLSNTEAELKKSVAYKKSVYVEDFTFKQLLRSEICTREICEKFVYKQQNKVKISLLFKKAKNFTGK